MNRTLTAIVLLLPLLALTIWTGSLFVTRTTSPIHTVQIEGYDPRDLLHGRYIVFRYKWNTTTPTLSVKPNTNQGRFYLPEHDAPRVEQLFLSGNHDFAVTIQFKDSTPHIRDLLIDGAPWQETLANTP